MGTLTSEKLAAMAASWYEILNESPARREALSAIAAGAVRVLGKYISPGMLNEPDEVSSAFVELIDQIVFEMGDEHNINGGKTDEYIINDLSQRIEVYLDLYRGPDVYVRNLKARPLIYDDTVILRHFHMDQFVPMLMSEFTDQQHLKFPILRALAVFDNADLLNFFYEIIKNEYEPELKIVAALGLKNNRMKFRNWKKLNDIGDEQFESFIEYVAMESDNPGNFPVEMPDNIYYQFYKMLELESMIGGVISSQQCQLMLNVLLGVGRYNIESIPYKRYFYESLSRILSRFHCDAMIGFLRHEPNIMSFVRLVDSLPVELFERVVAIIEFLGDEFLFNVKQYVSGGKVMLDDRNSRFSGYLYSLGVDPILL